MGITREQFPFPCFFDDIKGVIRHGRAKTVLIILDSHEGDWVQFWETWKGILFRARITILCSAEERVFVERVANLFRGEPVCIKVGASEGGNIFGDGVRVMQDLPPQDLILSSSPYDSYGEMAKAELEKALLPFLKKWGGIFLVHDPHFQVVRVADFRILKDRIFSRPWRIYIYTKVVLAIFRFSPLFLRNIHEGWIRVK